VSDQPDPQETPDALDELEPRARRDPASVAPEDHHRLATHYRELAEGTDDFRERRDHLRQAAFFVEQAVESGLQDPDALEDYLEILDGAAEVRTFADGQRRVQALIRHRLQPSTGSTSLRIQARATDEVTIHGGFVEFGDPERAPDEPMTHDDAAMEAMQRGEVLVADTGGYIEFPVELRLVDGPEPGLSPDEIGAMETCTAPLVLEMSSGRIAVGQSLAGTVATDAPELEVAPDESADTMYLEACLYRMPRSVIGLVCPTDKRPPNDVRRVDSIF
jgi:hypothetical protein